MKWPILDGTSIRSSHTEDWNTAARGEAECLRWRAGIRPSAQDDDSEQRYLCYQDAR